MKKTVFDVYDYQEQNKSVFIEHGVAVNKKTWLAISLCIYVGVDSFLFYFILIPIFMHYHYAKNKDSNMRITCSQSFSLISCELSL